MYGAAPSDLAKQPQGSISFLSPGDVISYQSPGGVEPGHAAVVNTVTPIGLGRFEVEFVQQNGYLYTSGILSNGTLTMTTAWISDYPVIGVIHHPGAPPTAPEPLNLLDNASFENDHATRWTTLDPHGGIVQELAKKAVGLPEGGNELELSTSRSGGSLYQDVPVLLAPGESYTFSLWALADAASGESICVALWGIGESSQNGETCTKIGRSWTRVAAPYDVTSGGLTMLRAQLYLLTAGVRLDVTGASLVDDSLENAGFEGGLTAGWSTSAGPRGSVRLRAQRATDFAQGAEELELSTTRPGGSVYQNVTDAALPGQSYTFSVWARAGGKAREPICVVLWGLGRSTQHGQTCTSVSTAWKLVSAPYDVSAGGLSMLRAQVYLLASGSSIDLAGASLVDDSLENAAFEGNLTAGWSTASVARREGLRAGARNLRPPGGRQPPRTEHLRTRRVPLPGRASEPFQRRELHVLRLGKGERQSEGEGLRRPLGHRLSQPVRPDLRDRRAKLAARRRSLRRERRRRDRATSTGLPAHQGRDARSDRRIAGSRDVKLCATSDRVTPR